MALEFNADKERIVADNLEIRNLDSLNNILGSGSNEKSAIFANLTADVDALVRVGINTTNPEFELDVNGQIRTTTSIISDTARINNLDIDTIVNPELILKAPILTTFTDPETGATIFPTSTTPAFDDDSSKIATTNFVYNIATNDVGGRIYVSAQIGDDTFDGRSATKPVRSIKKAAQLASLTEQKETLIVAGGEYLEDNPISLPPKCSVVGDNIRLVICRPQNPGKHMFKAASENYVFGITFRDQIDETGNAIETWDFAYVFDDKQRFFYDKNLGGEFGRNLPVGYQFFGPQKFLITFSESTAVSGLEIGDTITASSGGSATITEVTFDEGSNTSGTFVIENVTGAIGRGDDLTYDDNGSPAVVVAREVESQRVEGEVVRHVTSHEQYSVLNIEASDDYPDGLIFTLDRYHDYEAGQYLDISDLPTTGTWADLNRFNGRQKISHRVETTDGFSTKVVIYKDSPTDILSINGGASSSYVPVNVTLSSSDNYVVLTLLNSPYKFEDAIPNSFRYQDAVDLIQRNKDFIAEEAIGRMLALNPSASFDQAKCERDVKHVINHVCHDLFYGGNAATVEAAEAYLVGGQVAYVDGPDLDVTIVTYQEARDLCILAMRNWNTGSGAYSQADYTPLHSSIPLYKDPTIIEDPTTPTCANVASAITSLFQIVEDILNGNLSPARTYPTSYFTDQDGNVITSAEPWDDLPIIEVSPYIFNSSVISFIGGGGCEIDGRKVATPNVPRPNLPEQGKSMVAAAFTIISFGGTGYKVIEDGYTQLVSCFVIFCEDGVYADTGGYASITNSATNFGTYALRARGYRREPYSFHRGTIENITFDEVGIPTIKANSLEGRPLEHYIIKIGGVTNGSPDGNGGVYLDADKEYFIEEVVSTSAGPIFTVELKVQSAMDIFGNSNRYNDAYNLLFNNAEYIGDEAVGIIQNYSTLATAYTSGNTYEVGDIVTYNSDYYIAKAYVSSAAATLDTDQFQLIVASTDTIQFQADIEKCRRDTKLMVESWAKDLLNDANSETWDAAKLYIDGTNGGVIHITGYEDATKRVFGVASVFAKLAINNLLRKANTTLTIQEQQNGNYVAQYTAETPYRDLTIVDSDTTNGDNDPNNYTTGDCTDVQASIDSLYGLVVEILDENEVTAGLVRNNGGFRLTVLNRDKLIGKDIAFHRPSIVNSSSHTWEYAGSGTDYNALPQNGGQTGSTETSEFEQVSQAYGRVYASGTDELGDFKVGYFAKVENRTGNITFGGTVEISEVSFLRISGGDIIVTGFSADNTLGGVFSSNSLLPTQKAVRDYISNNLGNFINKSYSTNPTPRALVELGDNGRINIDQLPALRPFNVYTVADETERLALEGPLAGDIAIQSDTSLSYILNNDLEFQVLEFAPDDDYSYSVNDVITANPSLAQATVTQYTHGYIDSIFVSDPGNNYTLAPVITIGDDWTSSTSLYSDDQVANGANLYTITNEVDLSLTTPTAPSHTSGSVTSDGIEYGYAGGTWTTGTSYVIGDLVNNNGNVYEITAVDTTTGAAGPTHTSGSVTIDGFTYLYLGSAWSATATYGANEYVGSNGYVYLTRIPVTTGSTAPTHTTGTVTLDGVDYTYVGDRATATSSISNTRLSTITITNAGGGYISNPSITITNAVGDTTGAGAQASAIARSRLYITIENNIKVNSGDIIEDFTSPNPYHVTILDAINTSAQNTNNWVQLTSSNIDASFITSGIINTSRLAVGDTDYPSNSTSFLRGDQKYAPVVQSLRVANAETPIVLSSDFTRSTYIEQVEIVDGGTGYTPGTYTDQNIFGGVGNGAKGNIVVSDSTVRSITVTNGGGGYVDPPVITFEDAGGTAVTTVSAVAYVSGGIVTEIRLLDGGDSIAAGLQVIITDPSGSGASAAATANIANGVIRRITITDGGIGYSGDYTVTPLPSAITSGQSGGGVAADLRAIRSTRSLNFNTVDLDIRRVDGNTPNSNAFSTVGAARFKKSFTAGGVRIGQFVFDTDGGVSIDQGTNSGLDADKLDGQEGNHYLNGINFFNNSIGPTKLQSDLYSISIDGSAGSAGLLEVEDTRTINTQPQSAPSGMQLAWKGNTTSDGLNDGGTLHSSLTIRRSGATPTDFSGGAVNSLAFTDNNNLYMRGSGSNFVSALTLVNGGNGYTPGTYSNVPLGGGEGTGLTADIVVNNSGNISSVTLVNSGHGYNKFGSASPTFIVDLPESYFGLDNGRTRYDHWEENQTYSLGTVVYVGNTDADGFIYEVTTAGTSGNDSLNPPSHTSGSATAPGGTAVFTFIGYTNAKIQATVAQTTGGNWQSWQRIWHEGNDGIGSGLNADKLDGRELDWILHAQNINKGTINNRRIPDNLSAKEISNSLIINVPDPNIQSQFNGPFYDFYLEGFSATNELSDLDTLTSAGLQLNLYTETNVNKGTIQVLEVNVNDEEADFYWTSGSNYVQDRLVQYGYNLYLTTAAITNSTTPPTHPTGTVSNFEFIKKIDNPYTVVTAELISGTLDDTVVKLGTAVRPATYYTIFDWGTNKDPKFNVNIHELTVDGSNNPIYRMGNDTQAFTANFIFHTSGNTNNYDAKIVVDGGSAIDGQGVINLVASDGQVGGNSIWHSGNVNFNNGFEDAINWQPNQSYSVGTEVTFEGRKYTVNSAGLSGDLPPTHTAGSATDGIGVIWQSGIGYAPNTEVVVSNRRYLLITGGTTGTTAPSGTAVGGTETIDGITYEFIGYSVSYTFNGFGLVPYTVNGNSLAVLRDSNGNFAANNITADLTGVASGNLALTGGTLTGGLKISHNDGLGISETNGSGQRLKITTSSSGAIIHQVDNSNIIFRTDTNSERMRLRNNANGGYLDVHGFIVASGNSDNTSNSTNTSGAKQGSTSGTLLLAGYYTGSDYIATIGTRYSSGGLILGYACAPKRGSNAYVSTAGNFNSTRTAIHIQGGGSFEVFAGSATTTAVGNDVTLTRHMYLDTNGFLAVGGSGNPQGVLDVLRTRANGEIGTVLIRQGEGNTSGTGTGLFTRAYGTQYGTYNGKTCKLSWDFYGNINSSMTFYRGGSVTGGSIAWSTNNDTERMWLASNGVLAVGNVVSYPTSGTQLVSYNTSYGYIQVNTSTASRGLAVNSTASTSQRFLYFRDNGGEVLNMTDANGGNTAGGMTMDVRRRTAHAGLRLQSRNIIGNGGSHAGSEGTMWFRAFSYSNSDFNVTTNPATTSCAYRFTSYRSDGTRNVFNISSYGFIGTYGIDSPSSAIHLPTSNTESGRGRFKLGYKNTIQIGGYAGYFGASRTIARFKLNACNKRAIITARVSHDGGGMHGGWAHFDIAYNCYTAIQYNRQDTRNWGGGLGWTISRPADGNNGYGNTSTLLDVTWGGATAFNCCGTWTIEVSTEHHDVYLISNYAF